MSEFNFNSQICADKVQSERLLALGLKKETADMCHRTNGMGIYFITALNPLDNPNDIPAWSLHRLIEMMPEEERIAEFIKAHPDVSATYPCEDLFRWHNTLTGSCEFGRRQFCKDNGIDLNGSYTVLFFLNITKNAYGGEVIKNLIREYGVMGG